MSDGQLQIVSFEQAKRLKEAGFDWGCDRYYSHEDCNPDIYDENSRLGERNSNFNHYSDSCSAPTVALALKWFRDEKNAQCGITCFENSERTMLFYEAKWQDEGFAYSTLDFDTYEAAESALLDELLNLLTKKS